MAWKKKAQPVETRSDDEIEFANRIIAEDAARIADEAAQCKESLKTFLCMAWPQLGRGRSFSDNWHIDCLTEHMEALLKRQITRLIINISPRSNKPVSVDELVLMGDGSRKRLGDLSVGDYVISGKKRRVRVDAVHEQGELETVCIRTEYGRAIVAAPDHPFLTPEGWVDAGSLQLGQALAVVASPLTESTSARKDEEFSLAGYFIGDGSTSSNSACITSGDMDYSAEIYRCAGALGFTVKTVYSENVGMYGCRMARINFSKGIRPWLRDIGIAEKNSYTKVVPQFVFEGSNKQIALFLAAYFHCDGCVSKKNPHKKQFTISFSSVSKGLLDGVQHLLLRLGIRSRLIHKVVATNQFKRTKGGPYPYYALAIQNEHDAAMFTRTVPIMARKKQRALEYRAFLRWFPQEYIVDSVVSVEPCGRKECRCITVSEDASFTVADVVVSNSTILSVAAPAWWWTIKPTEDFLSASYTTRLSTRDSRYNRNLIASKWYQERFGDVYQITKDQNEKGRFENDKGGTRIATAIDSAATGEGGSVRLFDDLNDLKTINSEVEREKAVEFYQVLATREVDPMTDVEICIQQRGDPRDITGYLLSLNSGWERVVVPMEYTGARPPSSLRSAKFPDGWTDPRTTIGELMHPERTGPLQLEKLKKTLGPKYAAQFQQDPVSLAGNLLSREDWNYWNPDPTTLTEAERVSADAPVVIDIGSRKVEKKPVLIPEAFEQVVQSWDAAFKDGADNDYVAGHVWARVGADCYMLSRDHGHKDFPATCDAIRRMSIEFPCPEKLIEDKASGPAIIQTLKNEIPGLLPVTDKSGKSERVSSISGYVAAGNCYLPNPNLYPWVWDVLGEMCEFPSVEHDDDTDAMSQALRHLFNCVANQQFPEFRIKPRVGDPVTAKHIESGVAESLLPGWRRWIAVSPGAPGCALWFCETPTHGIRIYRELDLMGMDAHEVGKKLALHSLPDIKRYVQMLSPQARWNMGVYLEPPAFAPIEPVGSYAELMEQGIADFVVEEGDWKDREYMQSLMKAARFNSDRVTLEDSSMDRFRALLAFQPPNFKLETWDRETAVRLAQSGNNEEYQAWMAAVEGRVIGEYPKLKIDPSCKQLISALGSARRGDDLPNPYMRAALIGTSAPPDVKSSTIKTMDLGSFQKQQQQRNAPVVRRRRAGRF